MGRGLKSTLNLVVWGSSYVENFLNHSLPSLFSSGNLIATPHSFDFQLMTTKEDFESIRRAPIFKRLENTVGMNVIMIDHIQVDTSEATHKYNRVSLAQAEGIRIASESYDAIFFLYPDFIYGKNALGTVSVRLEQGYTAVCCPIPFIMTEAVTGGLFEREGFKVETIEGAYTDIPQRKLVELSLKFPHPVNSGFLIGSGLFAEWPAIFSWNVPGQGQLIHSFHLHPIGVLIQKDNPDFFMRFHVSIDDEFVSRLYDVGDNIYLVENSDEVAICSLRAHDDPPQPQPGRRDDLRRAVLWAEEHSSLMLRRFVRNPFRWLYSEYDRLLWLTREEEARTFIRRVIERLSVPDSVLQYEDAVCYEARKRRSYHFKNLHH